MPKYLLIKEEPCPQCGGDGFIYDPHCKLCGNKEGYTIEWFQSNIDRQPCGHGIRYFIEEYECRRCLGSGVIRSEVELREALADMWR